MVQKNTIEDIIAGHKARNASLRQVFSDKKVDFKEPRNIECHFWTWNKKDAGDLAASLKSRGFEILTQRPAGIANDPERWNLEASVRQSIDLTLRAEFTDELVKLAASHGGLYDGWGTLL